MRTRLFALLVLAGCRSPAEPTPPAPVASVPAPATAAPAPEPGEDVLTEALAQNVQAPPATFREGHATVLTFDAKNVTTAKDGFVVQFPSHAPVTTPAVYDGKVFVSGGFRSREFYAFDAKTGKPAWAISLDDDGPSAPACEQGVCVFNTESCTVFAVEAATGKLRWSWWLGDPLLSSPTIAGGRVFASYPTPGGRTSHALAAFDLQTGKVLWQKWIDADVMSSPVANGEEVYATTFGGTVYRFAQASGAIRSARRVRATSAPLIVGKDVYYTQRDDRAGEAPAETIVGTTGSKPVYKAARKAAAYLDARVQTRSKYWNDGNANDSANGFAGGAPASAKAEVAAALVGAGSVANMQAFQGSRVLNQGDVNVNCMGDEVVATDRKSGDKRWSVKLAGDAAAAGGYLGAPPASAGGHLFVATLAGDVLRLDPATGRTVDKYRAGGELRSQPVIDGGYIYVGTQDGRLVAIDTSDRTLNGWTHWGANAARTGVN